MEEKEQYIINKNIEFLKDGIEKVKGDLEQIKQIRTYLKSRALNPDLCYKYNLFITDSLYQDDKNGKKVKRLVVPIEENNKYIRFIARAIEETDQPKKINSCGSVKLFNNHYIQEEPGDGENQDILFICEGWTDALSVESCDIKAIAINSCNNTNKLIELLEENKETSKKYKYIIALDNDPAGQNATKKLVQDMDKLEYKNSEFNIPQNFNDINEYLQYIKDFTSFKEILLNLNQNSNFNYLTKKFISEVKEYKENTQVKTGFKLLDEELQGIRPALYCLGAISGLGKTTFCTQLMTQMAKTGQKIMFFSLEQSEFELTIKNISRETKLLSDTNKKYRPLYNNMIINHALNPGEEQDNTYKQAFSNYMEISKNINIINGNFETTVENIKQEIEKYININKAKPIIFIDYLQIIQPPKPNMTDKQITDFNITSLKKISRELKVPIFTICSLNRENYNKTIDFTSFKESGAIEYSSDYLFGLQFQGMEKLAEKNETEKRKELREWKRADIRLIELVNLKNRFGNPNFKVDFKFYPQYSFFEEYKDYNNI